MTEDMARLPGNNQPEEIKSPNRPPLNAARLRELMHYEPETGRVVRRTATRGHRAGAVAGCTRRDGYQVISIDGYRYLAQRLAWLYVHGEWPPGNLDHINGNPSDNRIANLRAATKSQNQWNRRAKANNAPDLKGVWWHARKGKWQAKIEFKWGKIYLGLYPSAREAALHYDMACRCLHGAYARLVAQNDTIAMVNESVERQ